MANKNYEVRISAYTRVLVISAENEEQALDIACDNIDYGDFEHDSGHIHQEIENDEVEQHRRRVQKTFSA